MDSLQLCYINVDTISDVYMIRLINLESKLVKHSIN